MDIGGDLEIGGLEDSPEMDPPSGLEMPLRGDQEVPCSPTRI